jgi:membrane-associated phospholipid phosphatase
MADSKLAHRNLRPWNADVTRLATDLNPLGDRSDPKDRSQLLERRTVLESRGMLQRRAVAVAAACMLLGTLAMAIDLPVARWCTASPLPKELRRLIEFSEIFAHTTGVVALLVALTVLDPSIVGPRPSRPSSVSRPSWRGRALVRVVAAVFAGGLLADVIKVLVVRVRPRAADVASLASVFDTFDSATLMAGRGGHGDVMSFPSGHAAVAAGFATMLCWRYPWGWPVFVAFAMLAAAQRVFSSAHYPSDVAWGAGLGILAATLILASTDPGSDTMAGPSRP